MRALNPGTLKRVVAVLCLTEVTSWGVLYYAFPILAPEISRTTGWPITSVTGAFSMSLVTAAICGVIVGRTIDRFGPRPVMTAGSVLACPAVIVIAYASNFWVFVVGWIVAGVAAAGVFYAPAFAALTHWGGADRVRALTTVTIAGGLSSTVFAPLTAALNAGLGWRGSYLTLAAVLAVVTIPAHLFGLRAPWEPDERPISAGTTTTRATTVWRTRSFIVLLLAMCFGALSVYAVVVNLVPLLLERGLSPFEAAVGLGLGGIGQVASRMGYSRIAARTSPRNRSMTILASIGLTTALFAVLPGPLPLLLVLALLSGGARGVFTLLQATAVSDRWGTVDFGHLNGIMLAPVMLATAAGPWLGSVLAESLGSYAACFVILSAFAFAAAFLTPWTAPSRARAG